MTEVGSGSGADEASLTPRGTVTFLFADVEGSTGFPALVTDPTKNFDRTGAAAILQKRGGFFLAHFHDTVVGDRGTPIRMPAFA